MRILASTAAMLALTLGGCASLTQQSPIVPPSRWSSAVASRSVDPGRVAYPFTVTPEMAAFAHDATEGAQSSIERFHMLQKALFDPRRYTFAYDPNTTLPPPRAFAERRGNCLTFTVLFVSLSRSVNLPAFLVSVNRPESVTKTQGLVIINRHVAVAYRQGSRVYVFDFSLNPTEPRGRLRAIDDVAVAGLFAINTGAFLLGKGNVAAATNTLETAVRLAPRFVAAWIDLGVAQMRSGDDGAALAAFQRALEIEPGNPSALTNMAYLYESWGFKDQARAALTAASQEPSSPFSLIALAHLEIQRGDTRAAWKILRRAKWRAHGRIPEVYEAMARLAERTGRHRRAKRYLAKAARIRATRAATAPSPAAKAGPHAGSVTPRPHH